MLAGVGGFAFVGPKPWLDCRALMRSAQESALAPVGGVRATGEDPLRVRLGRRFACESGSHPMCIVCACFGSTVKGAKVVPGFLESLETETQGLCY